jgi:hypothetical protein
MASGFLPVATKSPMLPAPKRQSARAERRLARRSLPRLSGPQADFRPAASTDLGNRPVRYDPSAFRP